MSSDLLELVYYDSDTNEILVSMFSTRLFDCIAFEDKRFAVLELNLIVDKSNEKTN
jgi:hypothetical protein